MHNVHLLYPDDSQLPWEQKLRSGSLLKLKIVAPTSGIRTAAFLVLPEEIQDSFLNKFLGIRLSLSRNIKVIATKILRASVLLLSIEGNFEIRH
jgi:hypothetical protein